MRQNNFQITKKHHSLLGIASVAIGLTLPVLLVSFILATGFLESEKHSLRNDIESYMITAGLSFPVLHLLALIFALVGIFSKKTKKVFPIIGVVLNAILLIAGIALLVF